MKCFSLKFIKLNILISTKLLVIVLLSLSITIGYELQAEELAGVSVSRQKNNSLKVIEIKIIGNQKIESEAIKMKLSTKLNSTYDAEILREDIQSLFAMGYFYNIQVDKDEQVDGIHLTYIISEKPSIAGIEFSGNDELDNDELTEAIETKEFEVIDIIKLQDDAEKLEKLYEDKGFFLAKVSYKLVTVEKSKNKKIIFQINENEKVQIKKISFLGNDKLTDGFLKDRIQTKEGGLFSFVSGSGSYKQNDFDRDLQILNLLYFNEGFIQVKIDRPEVQLSPDRKNIFISIGIEEGEQFEVGKIDFSGDLLFPEDELLKEVHINDKNIFVWEALQKDLRSLQAKYGDLGYAFTNVIPRIRPRVEDKKVDLTFEFDKGNKVYFGKINIVGNKSTRDKVVRRELTIVENELYNETKKRESLANIKRLGFFDDIQFNTKTPVDQPNRIDVDIVIKERNTGSIQVGAGFSSFSGFIFNGQVNESNFLGRGQRLGVSIDLSNKNSLFNLSFTEPYFLDSNWSVGVDAFRSRRVFTQFVETKTGGAIRVGHPLAKYLRGFIRYKLDDTKLELEGDNPDTELFPVETVNGITSSLTFTLEYDNRNDRFAPSKGVFFSNSLEYAGLGGDLKYTKLTSTVRYFKKLFWDVVWRNNLSYGIIKSNNSNDPPFNELFLLGGSNNLRGFDFFSIGKKKFSIVKNQDEPFGGKQQIFLQTELEFPLVREAGIKGVLFADIGEAEDDFTLRELRSDIGFGFRWFSPIGPLRFEWGFPIDKKDGEKAVNFQFAIGAPF